jgi:hypothetical protein
MTIIWLIVWLVSGTPPLHQWNAWLVSLIVVLVLDLTGGSSRAL